MRTIDADVIIRSLEEEYHGMLSDESMKIYQILKLLDDAPTIEPKQEEDFNTLVAAMAFGFGVGLNTERPKEQMMIRSEQLLKAAREQDHTCEFCYYELFDDKAYPCSRCVCNQPTENMWRPTDATDDDFALLRDMLDILLQIEDKPTPHDDYIETENDHLEARCLNCNNAKACKEKHWGECVYEPKDEPQAETKKETQNSNSAFEKTDCQ